MKTNQGDILQPLPLEKWSLLADTLIRDWPRYAYYHYWVKNVIHWREKEPNLEVTIYCPEGKYDLGVFIAISSHSLYFLYTFAFEESRSLLFNCLTMTNQIDWSRWWCITGVHENFEDTVRHAIDHLIKKIRIKVVKEYPTNFCLRTKEACIDVDIAVPDGMELRSLGESDIPVIHDAWPLEDIKRNPNVSVGFISNLQKLGKGIGLYIKKENKLISWAMQNEWGGLGNIQTLVEYQRRGYAKIVVKALSKKIAEEDKFDITAFIELDNAPSIHMFSSLGFKQINIATCIVTDVE